MIGREPDRGLEVHDRVVPVRLVHEAATEQRLRKEALNPRQPLHLGIPRAEHVVGIVVSGIDLDGAGRLVVDDFRVAHPFLAAFGP